MRKGDITFSVISLGLSLWLILESQKFAYASKFGIGPGFFPFWLGIALGGFALYSLIGNLIKKKSKGNEASCLPGWRSLLRVALIMVIMAGFALAVKSLGFTLAVFLFVAVLLYALEGDGIVKSLFYGVMFSAAVFLIFQYWLEVDLPKGLLGI